MFLCGRCASLHRKLGEDVSFVKSLSLDKWDEEDLDVCIQRETKTYLALLTTFSEFIQNW